MRLGGEVKNREFAVAFNVNSKGLRDTEEALASPEVICLGDSFSLGWGVEEDERYCAYVSRAGYRTLNVSMSSYGTVRELKLLNGLGLEKLKYLVIQHSGNDAFENGQYAVSGNRLDIMSRSEYDELVADHLDRSSVHGASL